MAIRLLTGTTIVLPVIHMNGTSKEALVEQLTDAMEALMTAEHALANASPNGRDYYMQDPGALELAVQQHRRRLGIISDLRNELNRMAEAIDEGVQS